MSYFEISWNQIRRGAHSSEEIGDSINGKYDSLEAAIAQVQEFFRHACGRDEKGMWYTVAETDENGDVTIVFTSEEVE